MHTTKVIARTQWFRGVVILFATLLASGCDRSATIFGSSAKKDREVTVLVYNYSGQPLIAVSVEDSAGGQGTQDLAVPDGYLSAFGGAYPPKDKDYSVVVQWHQGVGRVHWLEARLPVKIEQAQGERLEIYLRPDHFVCASLLDGEHTSHSNEAEWARVTQDRSTLSCVMPTQLPDLVPNSATGFRFDRVTHSWQRHEGSGTKSFTWQKLWHKQEPVRFRRGEAYRGGPWFLDEFYSVQTLGDQAALLVEAPPEPAKYSFYVVTGNEKNWSSRILGQTQEHRKWLDDNRVVIDNTFVVDMDTAAIYRLPYNAGITMHVLEQTKDREHLAIYFRMDDWEVKRGAEPISAIAVMNLENGTLVEPTSAFLPASPAGVNYWEFADEWYRKHCKWQDQDAGALQCSNEG